LRPDRFADLAVQIAGIAQAIGRSVIQLPQVTAL